MRPESLEVLNISNVSAQGDIVLNDEKLLELVQLYPFLYNPRVKGFRDPDYEEWAWQKIATTFNQTYGSIIPEIPFTIAMITHRWKMLQPIILSLSNSYDINAIPGNLRQHVVKLSMQMGIQSAEKPDKLTAAQKIILENISMVEQLPLELRKSLEREIMAIILNSEIGCKATIKRNAVDNKKVEQDYINFITEIGIVNTIAEDMDNATTNQLQAASANSTKPKTGETPLSYIKPFIYSKKKAHVPFLSSPKTRSMHEDSKDNININNTQTKAPLGTSWVPLSQATLYVRRCVVRLKRTKAFTDDIPLARLKEEKLW